MTERVWACVSLVFCLCTFSELLCADIIMNLQLLDLLNELSSITFPCFSSFFFVFLSFFIFFFFAMIYECVFVERKLILMCVIK